MTYFIYKIRILSIFKKKVRILVEYVLYAYFMRSILQQCCIGNGNYGVVLLKKNKTKTKTVYYKWFTISIICLLYFVVSSSTRLWCVMHGVCVQERINWRLMSTWVSFERVGIPVFELICFMVNKHREIAIVLFIKTIALAIGGWPYKGMVDYV